MKSYILCQQLLRIHLEMDLEKSRFCRLLIHSGDMYLGVICVRATDGHI